MLYVDYTWDLHPWGIKFDDEINIDRLGWKSGDHFKLENINGQIKLVKVDPVVSFVKGYKVNVGEK